MKKNTILVLFLVIGLIGTIFIITKIPSTPDIKPLEKQTACNLVEKVDFTIIKTDKACVYFDNNLDLGFSNLDSTSKSGLNTKIKELSHIYIEKYLPLPKEFVGSHDILFYKQFDEAGQKSVLIGVKQI